MNYRCAYQGERDDGLNVTHPRGTDGIRLEFTSGASGIIAASEKRIQGVIYLEPDDALALAEQLMELVGNGGQ